jgi:hypothetical protein
MRHALPEPPSWSDTWSKLSFASAFAPSLVRSTVTSVTEHCHRSQRQLGYPGVAEIVDERAELSRPTSVADLARSASRRHEAGPVQRIALAAAADGAADLTARRQLKGTGTYRLQRPTGISAENAARRGQPGSDHLRIRRPSGQTSDTREVQKLAILP